MLGVCGAELWRGMAPREISREGTRPARGCELEGPRARLAAALVPISAFSDSSALSSGAAAPRGFAAPAPDSWAASSPGLHRSSLSDQHIPSLGLAAAPSSSQASALVCSN